MAYFQHTTGFTRGEISENLYDRADVDFYQSASKYMENWFPDIAGGVQRRPGLKPLIEIENDNDYYDQHLVSFAFRTLDILVWFGVYQDDGDDKLTIRLYKLQADDASTITKEHETTITLDLEPERSLSQEICVTSVGPALFVTSQLFPPQRVFVDLSDLSINIEEISWKEEIVGQVQTEQGSATIDGVDTIFEDQLSSGDEIEIDGEWYEIDSITNQEELTLKDSYSGLSVVTAANKSISNPFGGNPRLCLFFKGRLFLFSSIDNPVTMWASKVGDPFTILSGNTEDDSPIEYELLSAQADEFIWVSAAQDIYLGGAKAEYRVSSLEGQPISPANFAFTQIASIGGAAIQPAISDAAIIFAPRGRTQIFAVQYDFQRAGFTSNDISLLAPHLLEPQVRDIVFRPATGEDVTPRLFILLDNFEMRTVALSQAENVIAWARFTVPESFSLVATEATAANLYTVVADSTHEQYWLCILRDPPDQYYVMDFEKTYTPDSEKEVTLDDYHLDRPIAVISEEQGFLGYYETETNPLDLSEIEGELGDVYIGVPFISTIQMLPSIVQAQNGMTINRKSRLIRALVSVQGAYQLFVNNEPLFGSLPYRTGNELPVRDGVFERRLLGWTFRDELKIESASIYKAKLLSVTREVNI